MIYGQDKKKKSQKCGTDPGLDPHRDRLSGGAFCCDRVFESGGQPDLISTDLSSGSGIEPGQWSLPVPTEWKR